MHTKKQIIATLCVVACLTAVPISQAYAVGPEQNCMKVEIMPLMEYISDAGCDFYIEDGVAYTDAYVVGYSSMATKCEIEVELQEKSGLLWKYYDSWSVSENGRRADLNESTEVSDGKSYRVVTKVTVWSGTKSETQTLTSKTLMG